MKVRELIEQLQQYDLDVDAEIGPNHAGDFSSAINRVGAAVIYEESGTYELTSSDDDGKMIVCIWPEV